ncbi:TPA: topoisomerase IV, partial [Streptococcus pneumoniae]
ALVKVPGLFNKDLEYKPLDENIEEKIISQTFKKRLETAHPDEVLNKDIEIITKEGKLYYLK